MTKISTFKSIDFCGKVENNVAIEDVFDEIKNHYFKNEIIKARNEGKHCENLSYEDKVFRNGEYVYEKRNLYEHLKNHKIPVVTWSVNIPKGGSRRKNNIEDEWFTGLVYYDIDDFTDTSIEEVESFLKSGFDGIKAVWRSLSYEGLGFLFMVDGLNKNNYWSTWHYYRDFIVNTYRDKVGKDLKIDNLHDFTRINVVSFDPKIYVSNSTYHYPAIKEYKNHSFEKTKASIKTTNLTQSNEVSKNHSLYFLEKYYNDSNYYNSREKRLTYTFYQKYFSATNIYGISLDDSFNLLIEKSSENEYKLLFKYRDDDTVYKIGEKQYNFYSADHGTWIETIIGYDDYIIKDVNVEFKGTKFDIDHLINYYYYNLEGKKTSKQFLANITKKVKEKGVHKRYLIEFLQKKKLKTKLLSFVDKTYMNPIHPFGLIMELKEDIKKNLIEEQHKKFIIEQSNKKGHFPTIFNEKIKDFPPVNEKEEYLLYHFLLESIIRENLDVTDIDESIKASKIDIKRFISIVKTFYNNFSYLKGLVIRNNNRKYRDYFDISKEILLENNEYLSDIKFETGNKNLIVWSDTNTGKTTYICEKLKSKRIVLVPVIPLLRGIENKYGTSVFYGDKKNVTPSDNVIICTFKSFPNLFGTILSWGSSLSDYELHIDEGHNFTVSANKKYRNYELNFIIDKIEEGVFKKVMIYTGTWIYNVHPCFKMFDIVRITRKNKVKKKIRQVFYEDLIHNIEALCDKDGLNVIYLQNKKTDGKLGKFVNYFLDKGWDKDDIFIMNADKKETDEFKELINDEIIPENKKLCFITSLLNEGLNIYNNNVKTIHLATFESPHIIEQIANRFRNNPDFMCYYYNSANATNNNNANTPILNVKIEQLDLVENSNLFIEFITKSNTKKNNIANKIFFNLLEENRFIRFNNNMLKIDYISIAEEIYRFEKTFAKKNKTYIENILTEYNWEILDDIITNAAMSTSEKQNIKNKTQQEKDNIKNHLLLLVDNIFLNEDSEILEESLTEESKNNIYKNSKYPSLEIDIRQKILFLNKNYTWDSIRKIIEEYINSNLSATKWKAIYDAINVHLLINSTQYKTSETKKETFFERKLMKFYHGRKRNDKRKQKFFTISELTSRLNQIKLKTEYEKYNFTSENIFEVIEQYFKLIPEISNDGEIRFALGGLNAESDVIKQTYMLKKKINELKNNNTVITKDDIYNIVSTIWKKCPILKRWGLKSLTKRKAFLIFTSHCEVSKVGRRFIIIEKTPWVLKDAKVKDQEVKLEENFVNM